MIDKSVCVACWRAAAPALYSNDKWFERRKDKIRCCPNAVVELKDTPPPSCKHMLEQAVSAGMKTEK